MFCKILGYKVKVRAEGFDVIWSKGKKAYSFNLGVEGNEGQMAVEALERGFEHIQVVLNDDNAKAIEGFKAIVPQEIDLRGKFNIQDLIDIIIPANTLVRRKELATKIFRLTGLRNSEHIILKAVEMGLIEKFKEGHRTALYKRRGGFDGRNY